MPRQEPHQVPVGATLEQRVRNLGCAVDTRHWKHPQTVQVLGICILSSWLVHAGLAKPGLCPTKYRSSFGPVVELDSLPTRAQPNRHCKSVHRLPLLSRSIVDSEQQQQQQQQCKVIGGQ